MPEDAPYLLHSVSVVVTAEYHNPSILTHDFLQSREIVPPEWEPAEAITTPPVSSVRYPQGIHWIVGQSNLTVTENCESPFRDDYLVYEIICKYLGHLPHVNYRDLGLNCVVSRKQNLPEEWLTERFLRPGTWSEYGQESPRMVPRFILNSGAVVCNLSFDAGAVTLSGGKSNPAVIVNVNMHHRGPLDVGDLRMAIGRWKERQEFVISALDKLLKRSQT